MKQSAAQQTWSDMRGIRTRGAFPHPLDWWDSCARAELLRDAYFRLLSGKAESLVRYQANRVEREVRYSQMDLARLEAEMRAAE